MSFNIRFIGRALDGSVIGNALMDGEIVLEKDRERFQSAIGYWSPADYVAQWHAGAARAAFEGRDSCLITSITDPSHAEYLQWWLLYPRDGRIIVQDALLLFDQLEVPFSPQTPYSSIPPHAQETEEGQPISEWIVTTQAVRDFLALDEGG